MFSKLRQNTAFQTVFNSLPRIDFCVAPCGRCGLASSSDRSTVTHNVQCVADIGGFAHIVPFAVLIIFTTKCAIGSKNSWEIGRRESEDSESLRIHRG